LFETLERDSRATTRILQTETSTGLLLFFVEFGFDRGLDLVVKRLVVFQDFFCGIAALGKLRPFVIQPGTALFDDLLF